MSAQPSRHDLSATPAASGLVAALLLKASKTIAIDRAAAKALVAQVFETLDATDESAPPGGLATWQVKRVDSYIETHLAETITVDQLASHAKLSASYLEGHSRRASEIRRMLISFASALRSPAS